MIRGLASLGLVVLLVGCSCEKVKEPPPSQSNLTPTPASAKTAPPEREADIDLQSLPIEQDYEEEAEKLITPKTLLENVEKLDKEISGQ